MGRSHQLPDSHGHILFSHSTLKFTLRMLITTFTILSALITIYNNTDNSGLLIFQAYTTTVLPCQQHSRQKTWKNQQFENKCSEITSDLYSVLMGLVCLDFVWFWVLFVCLCFKEKHWKKNKGVTSQWYRKMITSKSNFKADSKRDTSRFVWPLQCLAPVLLLASIKTGCNPQCSLLVKKNSKRCRWQIYL